MNEGVNRILSFYALKYELRRVKGSSHKTYEEIIPPSFSHKFGPFFRFQAVGSTSIFFLRFLPKIGTKAGEPWVVRSRSNLILVMGRFPGSFR